jgi:hypothetical protein
MPAFAILIAIGLSMFLVLSFFVVSLVLRLLGNELTIQHPTGYIAPVLEKKRVFPQPLPRLTDR